MARYIVYDRPVHPIGMESNRPIYLGMNRNEARQEDEDEADSIPEVSFFRQVTGPAKVENGKSELPIHITGESPKLGIDRPPTNSSVELRHLTRSLDTTGMPIPQCKMPTTAMPPEQGDQEGGDTIIKMMSKLKLEEAAKDAVCDDSLFEDFEDFLMDPQREAEELASSAFEAAETQDQEAERRAIHAELFADPPYPVGEVFAAKHAARITDEVPVHQPEFDSIIDQVVLGSDLPEDWHSRKRFQVPSNRPVQEDSEAASRTDFSAFEQKAMRHHTTNEESGRPSATELETGTRQSLDCKKAATEAQERRLSVEQVRANFQRQVKSTLRTYKPESAEDRTDLRKQRKQVLQSSQSVQLLSRGESTEDPRVARSLNEDSRLLPQAAVFPGQKQDLHRKTLDPKRIPLDFRTAADLTMGVDSHIKSSSRPKTEPKSRRQSHDDDESEPETLRDIGEANVRNSQHGRMQRQAEALAASCPDPVVKPMLKATPALGSYKAKAKPRFGPAWSDSDEEDRSVEKPGWAGARKPKVVEDDTNAAAWTTAETKRFAAIRGSPVVNPSATSVRAQAPTFLDPARPKVRPTTQPSVQTLGVAVEKQLEPDPPLDSATTVRKSPGSVMRRKREIVGPRGRKLFSIAIQTADQEHKVSIHEYDDPELIAREMIVRFGADHIDLTKDWAAKVVQRYDYALEKKRRRDLERSVEPSAVEL